MKAAVAYIDLFSFRFLIFGVEQLHMVMSIGIMMFHGCFIVLL
jgi:hypothetical protein